MNAPGDPSSFGERDGMKRLQEALEIFLRWKEEGEREPPAELLDRHPDLREFLEPLLEEDDPDEEKPGRMGDFELLGELGRGGMGVVYEARQISLDRKVALKVLSLGPGTSPSTLARFRREARVAAGLDHPGLVKILAFGNEGDTFFPAMELVNGASLEEILREAERKGITSLDGAEVGRITASLCGEPFRDAPAWRGGYVECVLGLILQVARALDHAHRAGIVHRDVKPSNILVRPDGKAILTDFGLAREQGRPTMTMTGDFVGTPHYVSPEQAKGQGVDGRTDVFSLGATLYELLTLRKPFSGDSTHQVLGRILAKEPLDPLKINPHLHPDLSAVVLKALEKDPARRYASAGETAADMEAFLEYRPVSARRPTWAGKLRKWVRREPLKAALAGLLALAAFSLGGMGLYVLARQGEIRLAREAAKREKLEDLLGLAFLVMEENPPRAKRLLERAAALAPEDREVRLARRLLAGGGEEGETGAKREGPAPPGAGGASSLDHFLEGLRAGARADRTLAAADFVRALRATDRAVLLSPRPRALYFYHLALIAFKAAEAGKAEKAARKAARRAALALASFWPERPYGKLFRATALAVFDPAEGLEALEPQGEDESGRDHTFFRIRAFCLQSLGRIDDALAAYREDLARHGRDPKTASAVYLHMGYLSSRKGDRKEAVAFYEKAAREDPDFALPWNNLGLQYLERGEWNRAERCLRKAAALRPEYVSPWMNLGTLYKRRGFYREALRLLRKALTLDPGSYRVRANLAWVLRKLGAPKEAEEHYRFLIRLDPDRADAYDGMGLLKKGSPAEALYWFRAAVEREPEKGRYRLNLGTVLARMGSFREALPHLEKAVRLDPGFRISHKNLVRIYRDLKRPGDARKEILRWLAKEPDSRWDWFTLAEMHAGGELASAGIPEGEDIRAAEKIALLTGRSDPEALLFLAEILRRRGKADQAWKVLEESRRLLGTVRLTPSKRKRAKARLGRLEASWKKGGSGHGTGSGGKESPRGGGKQGPGIRRGPGPGR